MVLLREGGMTQPVSPELNPKENLWDEIREKIFKNYAMYDPPRGADGGRMCSIPSRARASLAWISRSLSTALPAVGIRAVFD
jgi:hypothetical protein